MDSFLLLTRAGFEADAAAEIEVRAAQAGLSGFARVHVNDGWLEWTRVHGNPGAFPAPLIFANRTFAILCPFADLPETDRAGALAQLVPAGRWGRLELLHADTNEGRSLNRFLPGFEPHLKRALTAKSLLASGAEGKLGFFFQDSRTGFVCREINAVPTLPRLRLHAEAPSRSALKLEEACLRFFTPEERARYLRPGMTAVDLGAAPGGWSWYLARQGMKVTGVDHGRLQPALLANYPVTQVFDDAYTWKPPRAVDWVVCDVVEKPARTQALMLKWLSQSWARQAVFNLKLPMKQRFRSVWPLLENMEEILAGLGDYRIEAHQLYHDREEITVLVMPK